MKKILYIFILFSQFIWAQTPFEKGNEYYQKGNYQEAISQYQSILDKGQESAEVYFNLGNCFYKLNKVAPAVYNFEKALLLRPNDTEIQNNLAFAQKMAIDDIQEVPQVGFAKLISDLTSSFHFDTWAWMAIVVAFLFLGCFVAYFYAYSTRNKRIFFSGMLVFLFLVVVSVFSGFFEFSRTQNEKPAIVYVDTLTVKSEPNSSASTAFVLHAGTKVFVLEALDNFYKIQLADQKEGWVEKSAVKEIK